MMRRASMQTNAGSVEPTVSAASIPARTASTGRWRWRAGLDERAGAGPVATGAASRVPKPLVASGEDAAGAGLGKRGRAGKRAGLAARISR
jgi:hypothetical protein